MQTTFQSAQMNWTAIATLIALRALAAFVHTSAAMTFSAKLKLALRRRSTSPPRPIASGGISPFAPLKSAATSVCHGTFDFLFSLCVADCSRSSESRALLRPPKFDDRGVRREK